MSCKACSTIQLLAPLIILIVTGELSDMICHIFTVKNKVQKNVYTL